MKTIIKILTLLIACSVNHAMAQADISGTWQGDLTLGPDATLTVQFILQQETDGSWSAVVHSPDTGGIKNVPANVVEFDGANLQLEVAELSGAYAGVLKDGSIEGEWSQAGESLPLNLKPYVKPVMSQADMDLLLGEWNGKLEIPAGALTLLFRFEMNEAGELAGFIQSPDQGGNETPVSDIALDQGALSLKVPAAQVEIKGKITDHRFVGEFKQGQGTMPLTLDKGKYEPQVNALSLSAEAMDQLLGEWHGELDTPAGTMAVVYRFETSEAGDYVAYRDNPDQGATGIPVTEAVLEGDTLTIKTAGPGGGFSGKLAGAAIQGEMTGPMGAIPLSLQKGQYTPAVYPLELPLADQAAISGKWKGTLNTPQAELAIVLRFETGNDGAFYGYVDSPDQGVNGIKVTEAAIIGGELNLSTRFPRARYTGRLSGNEIQGQWQQGPGSMPLTLSKD